MRPLFTRHTGLFVVAVIVLGAGLAQGCEVAPDPNAAAFVTRLGDDTLAVESFRHTGSGMEADVVLRTPVTTFRQYALETDESGILISYTAEIRGADAPADAPPRRREVAIPRGDSLEITVTENDTSEVHVIAAGPGALPFIDMVHWPFDLMLMRAAAAEADSITQELFTTRGTLDFTVARIAPDSMTVTHPFRGTMMVDVNDQGRLAHLDAAQTTRKLVVERADEVDVHAVAARFVQLEAEGRAFGPLSGRGETVTEIDGATIRVDYGQPSKRGRVIWGELVPWGELWRTGANRATHFETDTPLRIGDVDVPAGTYTLYSIPEEDGGTLIINRQTGQGGTTYNEEMDLGRVPMERSTTDETVGDFTISIEGAGSDGSLQLIWDQSRFSVPIEVRR